jgi:hypothetical protein
MSLDETIDDALVHDAVLEKVDVSVEARRCELRLRRGEPGRTRLTITIDGVRRLELPFEQPWGPSASVLTASLTGENGARQLMLQMQSGDLFLIVADEVHAHVSSS